MKTCHYFFVPFLHWWTFKYFQAFATTHRVAINNILDISFHMYVQMYSQDNSFKWDFWIKGYKYVVILMYIAKLTSIKVVKTYPPTGNMWECLFPYGVCCSFPLKPFFTHSFPWPLQEVRDLLPIDPMHYQPHVFLFCALLALVIDSKTAEGWRRVCVKVPSVNNLIISIGTTVEIFQEDLKV